VYHYM